VRICLPALAGQQIQHPGPNPGTAGFGRYFGRGVPGLRGPRALEQLATLRSRPAS
jgi:hypothetical protein